MRNFPVYMIYLWTFVDVGRPQDIFPVIGRFFPGVLAAALCLGAYIISGEGSREDCPSLWELPEAKLFAAFGIMMLISTPFGYYPRLSLEFMKDFILKFGLYLYLVMKLITTRERIVGLFGTLSAKAASVIAPRPINPPLDCVATNAIKIKAPPKKEASFSKNLPGMKIGTKQRGRIVIINIARSLGS